MQRVSGSAAATATADAAAVAKGKREPGLQPKLKHEGERPQKKTKGNTKDNDEGKKLQENGKG